MAGLGDGSTGHGGHHRSELRRTDGGDTVEDSEGRNSMKFRAWIGKAWGQKNRQARSNGTGMEEKGLYSEPEIPNPMESASILSLLFWTWVNPMIQAGMKRQLSIDDMFPVMKNDKASHLGARLEQAWDAAKQKAREGRGPSPQLWRLALWELRWRILGVAGLILLESGQRISAAYVVRELILFLQDDKRTDEWRGYIYAVLLGGCGLLYAINHHQLWNAAQTQGWNLRVACMTMGAHFTNPASLSIDLAP